MTSNFGTLCGEHTNPIKTQFVYLLNFNTSVRFLRHQSGAEEAKSDFFQGVQ